MHHFGNLKDQSITPGHTISKGTFNVKMGNSAHPLGFSFSSNSTKVKFLNNIKMNKTISTKKGGNLVGNSIVDEAFQHISIRNGNRKCLK